MEKRSGESGHWFVLKVWVKGVKLNMYLAIEYSWIMHIMEGGHITLNHQRVMRSAINPTFYHPFVGS
jgi:hypothetical protein